MLSIRSGLSRMPLEKNPTTDMLLKMMKSKIHRATVTGSDLGYEGSITIDEELLEWAAIIPGEAVHVWNVYNGERFETYALRGSRGTGEVSINGAAARLAQLGDLVIVTVFCWMEEEAARHHASKVVLVDEQNRVKP